MQFTTYIPPGLLSRDKLPAPAPSSLVDFWDSDAFEAPEKVYETILAATQEAINALEPELHQFDKQIVIELIQSDSFDLVFGQNFRDLNSPETIEWAENRGLSDDLYNSE